MHEAGTFKATIVSHAFNTTKKGAAKFQVLFATELNQEINGNFYLSQKAAPYTMEKIRIMGYQGDDLNELAKNEYLLANNECTVTIKHETYTHEETCETKTSAKVDGVWPIGSGFKPKSETLPQLGKLNALLRAKPKVEAPKVEQDMKRTNDENDDYPF